MKTIEVNPKLNNGEWDAALEPRHAPEATKMSGYFRTAPAVGDLIEQYNARRDMAWIFRVTAIELYHPDNPHHGDVSVTYVGSREILTEKKA